MEKVDMPEMFAVGSIAYIIGDDVVEEYNNLDNKSKRIWDKERICHHGLFGLALALDSLLALIFSKNQLIKNLAKLGISAGAGLMPSDLHDSDRWFKESSLFEQ